MTKLTCKPFVSRISYQVKSMGYLHKILWKKCFVRKGWRNYPIWRYSRSVFISSSGQWKRSSETSTSDILRFLILILNFLMKIFFLLLEALFVNFDCKCAQNGSKKMKNLFLWMCLRIQLGNHQRVCITKLLKSLYPTVSTVILLNGLFKIAAVKFMNKPSNLDHEYRKYNCFFSLYVFRLTIA